MPEIQLTDGKKIKFNQSIDGFELAKNITNKFDVELMCDSNLREYKRLLKK